jgi:hypothetical protein
MRTLRSHRGLLEEKDMEERVVAGGGGGGGGGGRPPQLRPYDIKLYCFSAMLKGEDF